MSAISGVIVLICMLAAIVLFGYAFYYGIGFDYASLSAPQATQLASERALWLLASMAASLFGVLVAVAEKDTRE